MMAAPLAPLARLRWAVVRPLIEKAAPRRVLEVGCGLGGFGARIARRASYVGVEPDRASYEVARQRVEPQGGRVVHGTLDAVGVDDKFDMVCAFEVIEHLEDDCGAVSAWASRLVPGGTVVVSVPAWPERFGPWDRLAGHLRRYTPDQLDEVLARSGYEEVRHVVYGWPLGFALEAARNTIASRREESATHAPAALTAASGRLLQPNYLAGLAVAAGTAPFAAAQALRPHRGVGLVGVGRLAPPPTSGGVPAGGHASQTG